MDWHIILRYAVDNTNNDQRCTVSWYKYPVWMTLLFYYACTFILFITQNIATNISNRLNRFIIESGAVGQIAAMSDWEKFPNSRINLLPYTYFDEKFPAWEQGIIENCEKNVPSSRISSPCDTIYIIY